MRSLGSFDALFYLPFFLTMLTLVKTMEHIMRSLGSPYLGIFERSEFDIFYHFPSLTYICLNAKALIRPFMCKLCFLL